MTADLAGMLSHKRSDRRFTLKKREKIDVCSRFFSLSSIIYNNSHYDGGKCRKVGGNLSIRRQILAHYKDCRGVPCR